MRKLLLPCLVAVLATAAAAGEEPAQAVKDEQKLLAGKWRITAAEMDGEAVATKAVVTFEAGKATITQTGVNIPDVQLTVALDPTQKPKRMDTTNNLKQTHKGIYELKGDTLKAVFRADGKDERPTEFKSKKGEVLYTYERVKAK